MTLSNSFSPGPNGPTGRGFGSGISYNPVPTPSSSRGVGCAGGDCSIPTHPKSPPAPFWEVTEEEALTLPLFQKPEPIISPWVAFGCVALGFAVALLLAVFLPFVIGVIANA